MTAPVPEQSRPPPRRRTLRFWVKAGVANLLAFVVLFAFGEIFVRVRREGGLGAGLRSLVESRPAPRDLGTNNWIVHDEERGYTLNPANPGISSLRLRHPEIETPKPPGARRLLHLGDSVSWDKDGFVRMLAESLARRPSPAIEVINASVPGYTTHQERLTLERLIGPVEPDVVTLQYCLNDNHRFLHQLSPDGGWLITQEARHTLLPEGDGLIDRFSRWSYLAFEVRRRVHGWGSRDDGPFPWEESAEFGAAWRDETWPLVEDEIDRIVAVLAPRRIPLLVLAVPYSPQLLDAPLASDRSYTLKPQAKLEAICRSRKLPYLDLHPAFVAHRDAGLFTDGIHLTPEGHRLVVREFEDRLRAEGLLDR